ncbi:MAG: hypothetical protein JXQ97_03105 [Natronospirillum sp.]
MSDDTEGTQTDIDPTVQRLRTRKTLLFLAGLFVAPIVIVVFALQRGWLDGGVPASHQGQRLTPAVALIELGLTLEGSNLQAPDITAAWWLLFIQPSVCDAICETTQGTLRAVVREFEAAYGDHPRVQGLILHTEASSLPDQTEAQTHQSLVYHAMARRSAINYALGNAVEEQPQLSEAGYLYLMNPSAQILLYYPSDTALTGQNTQRKQVLADLFLLK